MSDNIQTVIINSIKCVNYTVNNQGKVFSLLYKKYLKFAIISGYEAVPIVCNNIAKRCYVHRLVAEAFIPNPNNYKYVNHKDGNKRNNNVDNLEWCTAKQNSTHAHDNGLKKSHTRRVVQYDLNDIKIAEFNSIQNASDATLIPRYDISSVCRGRSKSCKGFRFAYKENECGGKPWDRGRSVHKIEPTTGKIIQIFETVVDAAIHTKVAANYMVKCCSKPDYVFNGYLWKYADELTDNVTAIDFSSGNYPRIKINEEEIYGYFVCPNGRIWSEKQKKYLNPSVCSTYDSFNILHNGIYHNVQVHIMVAKAYIPNPHNYPIVNHKDGNKRNNNVDNLEWCTYSQNTKHAHDNGLINKYAKPVTKYDLMGKRLRDYDSIIDAAKDVGIHHTSISGALAKNTKSSGGFIWEYRDEKIEVKPKTRDNVRYRAVVKYSLNGDLILEYPSIKDAAKDMNVNHSSIIDACKNRIKSCKGFLWKYKDDNKRTTPILKEDNEHISSQIQHSNVKAVVKFDRDGNRLTEYPSVREAAKAHNTNDLNISRACRDVLNEYGGYIWAFKGKDDFIVIKIINRDPRSKKVVKYDLKGNKLEEYESASAAARDVGTKLHNISDACTGKSKTSAGFAWKYV